MLAPLVLLVFVIFYIGAIMQPRWALAVLLMLFPMKQALQGSVSIINQTPTLANYLIGIVVGIGLVWGIFRGKIKFGGYLNLIWIAVAFGYFYSCLSILWTPSKENAISYVLEGMIYVVMFIIIAPMLVGDLKEWTESLRVATVLGIFIAIFILISPEFNLRGGRLGIDLGPKLRTSPLAIGELGGFLMISTSLMVMPRHRILFDIIRYVGFISGLMLAIYSGSRGQLLFAVFITVVFFPLSRPVKNVFRFFLMMIGSLALLILIFSVISFLFSDRDVAERWLAPGDADRAVGIRLANFTDLLYGFVQSPSAWIVGLGLNAFSSLTNASSEPYSHSMFIDVFVEMGLPMFGLLIVCLAALYRQSIAVIRLSEDKHERSCAVILVAICVYQLLLMNKQGQMWVSQNTVTYFLLLAKIASPKMMQFYKDAVQVDDSINNNSAPI